MEIFRLAQVSDLHIATRPYTLSLPDWWGQNSPGPRAHRSIFSPSSHDPDLLDAVVRNLHHRRENLDAIILSGDLATTGLETDMRAAAMHIDSQPLDGYRDARDRPTFRSIGRELVLLPGNHDRYRNAAFFPAGREFDAAFRGYWRPVHEVQSVTLQINDQRLAIVCADFCLRNSWDATDFFGMLGQGMAYESTVEDLRRETNLQRSAQAAVIWVVHFPPQFPGIADTLRLLDDVNLLKAAAELEVGHILCGHTHHPLVYPPGDPPTRIYCAGTACQYWAPHGNFIHLYDIEASGTQITSVSRSDLRWVQAQGDFV
jgi:predicted phosphodiesterase